MPIFHPGIIAAAGASDWPDANSTGPVAGTVFINVPADATSGTGWSWNGGDLAVYCNSAGSTVQNLNVTGQIIITANNVTVQNCKAFLNDAATSVGIFALNPGATIQDCEVSTSSLSLGVGVSGIRTEGASCIVRRNNVSGCENGIFLSGINQIVEDNYIHDLVPETEPGDPHSDGIQLFGGNICDGSTISGNAVYSVHTSATSAYIMGDNANVTVDNNLFRGGYAVFRIWRTTSCIYTNNRVGDQSEVPGSALATYDGGVGDPTWTGNVNDDTDAVIPKFW